MYRRSFIVAALMAGCGVDASESGNNITSDCCEMAQSENECLGESNCAWASDGNAAACITVGPVIALDECSGQADPDACLAQDGCAWSGHDLSCFYVGNVTPQDACSGHGDVDACLAQDGCACRATSVFLRR